MENMQASNGYNGYMTETAKAAAVKFSQNVVHEVIHIADAFANVLAAFYLIAVARGHAVH